MENKNQLDSPPPPSSFTNDLFGVKDSWPTSVSQGLFSSIFASPSTVTGRNYSTSKIIGNEHKLRTGSQSLDARFQGDIKDKEDVSNVIPSKETNSVFQERPEPCPLSSSLYYGGQEDMYIRSSNPYTSGSYTNYKKDGGVDDPSKNNSNDVPRGNWWQGSLYY